MVRQLILSSFWSKALVLFSSVWIVTVLYFISKIINSSSNVEIVSDQRVNSIEEIIIRVEQQNSEIRNIINLISDNNSNAETVDSIKQSFITDFKLNGNVIREPSSKYEKTRRRINTNIQEFWNYIKAEVNAFKLDTSTAKQFFNLANDHRISLLNDMEMLKNVDTFESWREKEFKNLSSLIQNRLHYLQNPPDCNVAQKLVCRLNKGCGWGCQLHHLVYCFIMAYATERTLILKSKGWRYHKNGWEEVFMPLSETCLDSNGRSHGNWPSHPSVQVVTLPIIDSLNPKPAQLPLAIPKDLAPRLIKLHGNPIVFWIGQFIKYLLRPQPTTQSLLNNAIKRLNFKNPIVGIHIRRTDKIGTEASFHSVDEYMFHAEEYFKRINIGENERRVFVASDDQKVFDEIKEKYPSYKIIGDPNISKTAAVSTRYTDESLNGILIDIHLLSLTNFLVCTFSSQVCRVAYEIMQSYHVDASENFVSLDDIYYYGGQNHHYQEVVIPHSPIKSEQLELKTGDLVGVAGNHWNGFRKGKNQRTNQVGLYPSFKVNDKIEIVDFPTYPIVK